MAESLREQLSMAHSMIGMPYEHNLRAEITALCEQSAHRPELLDAAVVLLDSYGRVSRGRPQPSVYVAVLEACEAARTPTDAFTELMREQPKNELLATARKISLAAFGGFCKSVKGYGPESAAVTKLARKLQNADYAGVSKNMTAMVQRIEAAGDLVGAYCIVRDTQSQSQNSMIYEAGANIYDIKQRVKELGEQQLVDRNNKAAFETGLAMCTVNGSPKEGFHILDSALSLELYKAEPDWKFVAKAAEKVANFRHLSYAPHRFSGHGEEFVELRETQPQSLADYLKAAQRAQQAEAPEAAYGLMHIASTISHHERGNVYGNPDTLAPFIQHMATHLAKKQPELGNKFLALGAYSQKPLSWAAYGHGIASGLVMVGQNATAALYFETTGQLAQLTYKGPYARTYADEQKQGANQMFVDCMKLAADLRKDLPAAPAPRVLDSSADYLAAFKAQRLAL